MTAPAKSTAPLRRALDDPFDPKSRDEGLDAAREYARWHLGDPGIADRILRAYLDPEAAREYLAADRASFDGPGRTAR